MATVYLYESCLPTIPGTGRNTLIIQTERLFFTTESNVFFKDNDNICWKYLGESQDNYIAPETVYVIKYQGNFFNKNKKLSPKLFPDCVSCNSIEFKECNEIYFNANLCENGSLFVVKCCSSEYNQLKLKPEVGDICGVYNPGGGDFCVQLSEILTTGNTFFEISTPTWNNYSCDTCPLYNTYVVDSCDGTIKNKIVFQSKDSELLKISDVVRISTDTLCYEIKSYKGLKLNYVYDDGTSPTIIKNFSDCYNCLLDYYNSLSL